MNVSFVPCGHMICCLNCAKETIRITDKCPVCNLRKVQIMKIYRVWKNKFVYNNEILIYYMWIWILYITTVY